FCLSSSAPAQLCCAPSGAYNKVVCSTSPACVAGRGELLLKIATGLQRLAKQPASNAAYPACVAGRVGVATLHNFVMLGRLGKGCSHPSLASLGKGCSHPSPAS